MFSDLDPLLHSQARLAIMSILVSIKEAEFAYLLEHCKTSKGNLSFQISKLKEAGYLTVTKTFRGNYPLTTCKATAKGLRAYADYMHALQDYFKHFRPEE